MAISLRICHKKHEKSAGIFYPKMTQYMPHLKNRPHPAWIAVVKLHPDSKLPKTRLVLDMGQPGPHNIGELKCFLLDAIEGLPSAIIHVPVARLDLSKPKPDRGKRDTSDGKNSDPKGRG